MRGVDIAKEIIAEAIDRGLPLVIKGDPDVDGLFAWWIGYDMVKRSGYDKKIHYCINTDRRHGLVESEFEPVVRSWRSGLDDLIPVEYHRAELIINVDSSISGEEMDFLVSQGNFVISLDHHELELDGYPSDQQEFICESNGVVKGRGVLINNQYEFEPEEHRFWSGAGVVINALSEILGVEPTLEYEVLHGITLLSDVRDIENPLARGILEKTFTTPLNRLPMVTWWVELCQRETPEAFKRSIDVLDRTFVDYNLSPYINACFQLNLISSVTNLCLHKTRSCFPAKTVRKELVAHLEKYVTVRDYDYLTVLSVDLDEIEEHTYESMYEFTYTSFLGLLANRYLDREKAVVILSGRGSQFVRGSLRGISHQYDYISLFKRAGFLCKGHKGAFGIVGLRTKPNFEKISRILGKTPIENGGFASVVESKNLLDDQPKLFELAIENQYRLSQNFIGVLYTGMHYAVKNETAGTISYTVNDMVVGSFDKLLDPKNSLIMPSIQSNNLILTLRK